MTTNHQKLLLITISLAIIGIIVVSSMFLLHQEEIPPTTQSPKLTQPKQPIQSPTVTQPSQAPTQVITAEPAAIKLRFKPTAGQTLAFHFESESDTQIDFTFLTPKITSSNNPATSAPAPGNKTPVKMQASGELYLKYFALEPERWQIAARLAEVSYQLNGQTPRYAEAMSYPFTFQMTTTGFLSNFQFTKNIATEARQFVEQLLYTLQTTYPEEPKMEWQTKEIDMTGRYQAVYKLSNLDNQAQIATITKRKLNYLSTQAAKYDINSAISQSQTHIENSLMTVITPLAGTWLTSLEYSEENSSFSGTYQWAKARTQSRVHQIAKDLTQLFPATLEQFLAQMRAAKFAQSKYYNTDPYFDNLGKNLDMEGALALFVQLEKATIPNARRTAEKFLVNYLRQHPQTAFTLINLLDGDPKREHFDQSTQLTFWRLLTEAGHTEAQQAILNTLTDQNRSHITKMRALAYIHDFEYPEAATVEALWQFTNTLDPKQDREFRTMGLYALGSLGNQDKFNDTIKPEIKAMLTKNLENNQDPTEQAVTLGALGNYGGVEVLEVVEPYFTATDEKVRASAYSALRHIEVPQAVNMLAKHYAAETSPKVRVAALKNFSKMPTTVAGVEWANQTILHTETSQEQTPLVEVLGKTLKDYPDNERTLRTLLNKNLDNAVKKDIYKYIVPIKKRDN